LPECNYGEGALDLVWLGIVATRSGKALQSVATVLPSHLNFGHDPLVLQRYPAPKPDLEGVAVRLDVASRD
jgi:hypothetical protein